MGLTDFNLAKVNIPISVQRAFDKGKVAESYRQMYQVAVELASAEAKVRQSQKYAEYCRNILRNDQPSLGELMKGVPGYQSKRIEHHMNKMIRLLELYTQSHQKGSSPR